MKDISSKVCIRPFTSAEDLAQRKRQDIKKEEGFMTITLKKPKSLRPYKPTQHRMKWSKEVEKMPSIDIMNKTSSAALVGGALCNTRTSQWCSSSSNNNENMLLGAFKEDNKHFILPGSTGEAISEQLHQGITLRIYTTESHERLKSSASKNNSNKDSVLEHVPLCFDDELERQNVKVLTAKPPTVHTALPKVSETYTLISNTDPHMPFKIPGFLFLDTPKPQNVPNNKSHNTFIRVTDIIQNVPMPHNQMKNQRRRGTYLCSQNVPHIGNKTTRACSVHVLSADGNVKKYPINGSLFLHRHDAISSPGLLSDTSKSPPIPLLRPRLRSLTQVHVGPVVNGINPNENVKKSPSDYNKTVHGMISWKSSFFSHVTPMQSHKNVAKQNRTDFIVISKALQSNPKHDFDPEQQLHEEFWSREIADISHDFKRPQVTDDTNFACPKDDKSLLRPNSPAKHTFQESPEIWTGEVPQPMDDIKTCSETMSLENDGNTPSTIHQIPWSHAINVPTAERCE